MIDRNVQYPQRYQLVKVEGTDDIYDLIPAPGEVSEVGTLVNKATLLQDITAALFGLGSDAVPDDVFKVLSNAALYEDGEFKLPNGGDVPTVKIETGSYVGTGSIPVMLTFSFKPQLVFIGRDYTKDQQHFGQLDCLLISFIPEAPSNQYANSLFTFGFSGNYAAVGSVSQMFSDNTLYFNSQMYGGGNYTGVTYSYVAIGLKEE